MILESEISKNEEDKPYGYRISWTKKTGGSLNSITTLLPILISNSCL